MPELPEVEVLCRRLTERCGGRAPSRVELASISALKTYDPPLEVLRGATYEHCRRRGKYLVMQVGDHVLVVHLARAGWVHWRARLAPRPAAPGRGPLVLRVGFGEGDGFEVTEMGNEKHVAIYVATHCDEIEALSSLGVEPLGPAFSVGALARLFSTEKGDLKHALSRQALIAGVGNAYSDEALHMAGLSPFKPAAKLSGAELERLHAAVVEVLSAAVERAAELGPEELKDGKRQAMRVHGRTGEPCPVCGDTVREVSFATRSLQY
ncbi:MAG: DNA-formamidopyrimidine glycosylase family protein, partial [Acidimicrobiales bacterium]